MAKKAMGFPDERVVNDRVLVDETRSAPPVSIHEVVASLDSAEPDGSNRRLWRLSGHDLRIHVFRIDGGYLEPQAMLAIFNNGTGTTSADVESYGPYDVWVAACGHQLPVAMALPVAGDQVCVGCHVALQTPTVRSPRSAPHVRDWAQVEPLRRRRNAGASGKLPPVEIQL